ncbi:glutathione-disulfide reductase [Dongia rigui]|uniref:Glutathione reductase n=1 Tax=Dongia rigui TaxID=940149 RepID=A0ABU5E106_9PROT|nr:glutathione-disulfide reductase [Dongia rigui]MDY0873284.1 glutathione-disulfide reductase [Dongia rigui]
MSQFDYDLFVIGGGSGGVRAARIAAGHGAKVAVAEESRLGGTCVIRGCVPKKLLSYAAHFHEDFEDARNYGWTVGEATFDWATLIANKDKEIDRLNGIYKKLLSGSKVELLESRAVITDPHTLNVGGKRVTAKNVLIAVGGWPERPRIPGIEHSITSNEAFHLARLPKDVVIVGGGYIAVEFAGIFNGLGTKVTQLYRGAQILRGFDDDVRHFLAAEMAKKGIAIKTEADVTRIDKTGDRLSVTLKSGETLSCDAIMYATGRRPKTDGMGLGEVGVKLKENGAIAVDAASQTTVPNIHAVGDCTDRVNLTPVAIREGHAYADSIFGNKPWHVDHKTIASAVFSHPPVGVVGLSEADARKEGRELDIYKADFKPMKHTISGRDERTLMKLVVDRKTQVVLGAHMVGIDAPEIVQALAIAVKMGATKQQFDAAVAVHPTAAEEFVTMRTPVG